jgi:hypothetical protein
MAGLEIKMKYALSATRALLAYIFRITAEGYLA